MVSQDFSLRRTETRVFAVLLNCPKSQNANKTVQAMIVGCDFVTA